MKRLRAGFTFLLCLCLVAVEPGAGAWAAVAERVALPQGLRALSGPVAPTLAAPAPFLHTALAPSALAPSLVPAPRAGTAVLGARLSPVVVSPAALRTPSAELSASEAGRPFDQSGSAASAPDDPVAAPVTPLGPRRNLGLVAADEITLAAFTAEFHDETARQYGKYGFTVRDYYAWANYIRFFMPSLGVREAARRGAAYVYGDRLEDENELKDFTKALNRKIDAVIPASAALAKHGIDKAEAQRLLKIAEPAPETLADDEESPFHVPLAQLVPRLENVDLVPTPTTLRRIDSAYQAFSMRDFALLLGPPATQKSVIPKYLAAKLK
ncbi:MAG: hypothetical protein HYZ74_07190, partial [Elusimicrobia bacterium]|nr:hypothetical protein [Elusimicrobiota bacterium]